MPASQTVADSARCPWSGHSGRAPFLALRAVPVCASLHRRSLSTLAFGDLRGFGGRSPPNARKIVRNGASANLQPCRARPGMDRREARIAWGPAEFPQGTARREPALRVPGLSRFRALLRLPARPAGRPFASSLTREPRSAAPSADRTAGSCAIARSATPPEPRPLKPDKPIPRRARSASRLATAMRASYHSSPLACPGLRRSSPSPPEPASSPRSRQFPERPVPGSQPTRPRSARPRRDRSVPPLPGTGPAPRQPQPRRGPARSTPPSPRTSRDGAPSLVPPPRQAQARSPVRTVSRDSSVSLERFLGHARPSGSLPASPGSSADVPPCGPGPRGRPARQKPRSGLFRGQLPEPAFPQRPQGDLLPSAHGPESRNRPPPPSPRPGRGRAPTDLADAIPHREPAPGAPAVAAGRTGQEWRTSARVSPLAGRLSLSRAGRVGRTGQERSSRRLVRLGGGRPAVCPGNPLTTAGLPRIRPGRRRLHPAAPSRPSPCGVARPSCRLPRPRAPFRSPPILGLLGQAPEIASMGTLPRNPAGPSASRWLDAARARPAA